MGGTIKFYIVENYEVLEEATKDDSGIYDVTYENGIYYFFRGAISNNYVRFGKWMDDVLASGSGEMLSSSSFYLKRLFWYWTMIPYNYYGFAQVYNVNSNETLNYYVTSSKGGIAPVIELSAQASKRLKELGTMSVPYSL